jgi:pSer/pThr/pTyr-binding forkhead associated (FHA) protein
MAIIERPPFLTDPPGREHILSEQRTIVGRAAGNDIVISSARVSREHACLTRQGWHVILEDLGSTNGTYLNGERVRAPVELRDGDRVQVGDILLVFHDPNVTYRETALPTLDVDLAAGVVRVDRELVELSAKEFALLTYLYEHQGEVCSKDEIGQAVWPEYEDAVYDYQIENLVGRLRRKIESEPSEPKMLLTLRGLGYKLVPR